MCLPSTLVTERSPIKYQRNHNFLRPILPQALSSHSQTTPGEIPIMNMRISRLANISDDELKRIIQDFKTRLRTKKRILRFMSRYLINAYRSLVNAMEFNQLNEQAKREEISRLHDVERHLDETTREMEEMQLEYTAHKLELLVRAERYAAMEVE